MNQAQEIFDKFQSISNDISELLQKKEDGSRDFAYICKMLYYIDNEEVVHLETVRDINLILNCGIEIILEVEFSEWEQTDESGKISIFANKHGLKKCGDGSVDDGRIAILRKVFKGDKAKGILEEYKVLEEKVQKIAPFDSVINVEYFDSEEFLFKAIHPLTEDSLREAIQADRRLFFRMVFENFISKAISYGTSESDVRKFAEKHEFRVVDVYHNYNENHNGDETRYVLEKSIN